MMNALRFLFLGLIAIAPLQARDWVVAQAHPAADDAGPGTADRPFRRIAPAAAAAEPGDVVLVHAGVYRERVSPARGGEPERPIVYTAAPGETVVVTGSEIVAVAGRTSEGWDVLPLSGLPFEARWHPFRTPILRLAGLNCGLVFADGRRLTQARAATELVDRPGLWWYDAASDAVWVSRAAGTPLPEYEVGVRERVFAPHLRGLGWITVRGFGFQHAANQFPSGFWNADGNTYPQAGAVSTRSGHDWVVEDNVIREVAHLGLDIGVEGGRDPEGEQPQPSDWGRHLVRRNRFEACGAGAIAGYRATAAVVTENIISGTNWQGHTAPETGGVKLHFAYDARVSGNRIFGNDACGIWLDNVYTGARVEANLVHDNQGSGIFVEMGGGPGVVAWNVVVGNGGEGIYLHDASDVVIAHNLVALNRQFGVHARTVTARRWTDRDRDDAKVLVATRGLRIVNNVFIDNGDGELSLPFPSAASGDNLSDHNLFLVGTQWQLQRDYARRWHVNLNDGPAAVNPATRAAAWGALSAYARETGLLTLAEWRDGTGNDRHSRAQVPGAFVIENGAVAQGGFGFAGLSAGLYFKDTAAVRGFVVPVEPEAGDHDYFGAGLDAARVVPGPFQHLAPGESVLRLWPQPRRVAGE